jgi:hypothetical protein
VLPVAKVLVMMKEMDSAHTFCASLCVNKENVFAGRPDRPVPRGVKVSALYPPIWMRPLPVKYQ